MEGGTDTIRGGGGGGGIAYHTNEAVTLVPPLVPTAWTVLEPPGSEMAQVKILLVLVRVPCEMLLRKSSTESQLEYALAVMLLVRVVKVCPVIYTMGFVLQLALYQ